MHAVSPLRSVVLAYLVFSASAAFAQFTASIQGVVQDPTGAGVAKAQSRC